MSRETDAADLEASLAAAIEGDGAPSTPTSETPPADPPAAPSSDPSTPGGDVPPAEPGPSADAGGTPSGEGTPPAGDPPADPGSRSVGDAFLLRLKEAGVDLTGQYKDDDAVRDAFLHQRSLLGRRDENAQIGRMIRENPEQFFAQYGPQFGYAPAQQAAQPQTQPAAEPEKVTLEKLAEWEQAVVRDESGQIIGVKPGYDAQAAFKLRQFEQDAVRRQREFLADPDDYIASRAKLPEDKIRELVQAELNQRTTVHEQRQEANAFLRANHEWLIDPATNTLSQNGQRFLYYMHEGMREGIPAENTQALSKYALRAMQADARLEASRQQATPPAVPPKAQRSPNTEVVPPVREEGEYKAGEDFEAVMFRNQGMVQAAN